MKLGRQVAYDKYFENRPTFAVMFGFVMASEFCSRLGKIYAFYSPIKKRRKYPAVPYPTVQANMR